MEPKQDVQQQEKKEEIVEEKKPNMVISAHEAAERLREQNEIMAKNIAKLEELKAFDVLGGLTNSGEQLPQPKPETAKEYKDRVMRGEFNVKKREN